MKTQYVGLLAIAAALLAGCSQEQTATPADQKPTTIFEFMTELIDPDADAIWEIGNAALNDEATMDPAKMTDADWVNLKAAAERMATHSRSLEQLKPLLVVKAGEKIADEGVEGAPTTAMIEAHLKKDSDTFRALAAALTTHADDLAKASVAKDATNAGRLINEMDGVCESCHLTFWYPEQQKLIQEMGIQP